MKSYSYPLLCIKPDYYIKTSYETFLTIGNALSILNGHRTTKLADLSVVGFKLFGEKIIVANLVQQLL